MKTLQFFLERIVQHVRIVLFVSATCLTISNASAEPDMLTPIDLSSPEATAFSMMRAMFQGDAEMVDQVFLDGAQLRRVSSAGELGANGLVGWRDWVGSLEVGEAHEDIFGVTSETFGTLASVWAPFVITYQGDVVGCGVNQMTMTKTEDGWKIVFVMDTQAPKETCATFKETYLADREKASN